MAAICPNTASKFVRKHIHCSTHDVRRNVDHRFYFKNSTQPILRILVASFMQYCCQQMAQRISSSYRTVSLAAIQVLQETTPIDLLFKETSLLYEKDRAASKRN